MSVKSPVLQYDLTYENWFQVVEPIFSQDLAEHKVFSKKAANLIYTSSLERFDQQRKLPDFSKFLFNETHLFIREVSLIRKRLAGGRRFNLIDLHETTGNSSLPLIYESLASDNLAYYIPATICQKMNQSALRNLQVFAIEANLKPVHELGKFLSTSIQAEIFDRPINAEVVNIQKQILENDEEETFNVFLLLGSALSNDTKPSHTLYNIYQTMNSGDYTIISQSLYRSGFEDGMIEDYKAFYPQFVYCHVIKDQLNQEGSEKFVWEEGAVRVKLAIDRTVHIAGVELPEKTEVTLFESKKFKRHDLESLMVSIGFKIENIVLDDTHSNALYVLRK